MSSHQDIDRRSLALHKLVAEKLRQDPGLIAMAQSRLARWKANASSNTAPYFDQWQVLLKQGLSACLEAVLEDSPRATALRQCSPFAGVLTNEERFAFFKAWEQEHAAP